MTVFLRLFTFIELARRECFAVATTLPKFGVGKSYGHGVIRNITEDPRAFGGLKDRLMRRTINAYLAGHRSSNFEFTPTQ